jgi:alpha-D-ribose 1-methylphosphonate 5-triphosphate synthase subunit PhnG
MTRRARTEIIAKAELSTVSRMADQVRAAHEVRVIQAPQRAMVMVKFRETGRNGLFYLGELLVTEAKASIGSALGLGIVQDDDEEAAEKRAADAAVIDAAYAAALPETASWSEILDREAARLRGEEDAELGRIARSRVRFETMDKPQGA